jgi:hypothetical protein
MDKEVQIFLSYAHRDEPLAQELLKHLQLLKRQSMVTIWSTNNIYPGQAYTQAIHNHLSSAQLILLLISPDFLSSEDTYDVSLQAMTRHRTGETRVIPILLRPTDWKVAPFGRLAPLPTNGRPLTTWTNRDLAYLDIVEAIRETMKDLSSSTNKKNDEAQLQRLLQTFSERDLRLLGFDLGLPPGIFLKDTPEESVDTLINYMKDQDRTQELATYVRKRRSAFK